MRVPSTRAVSAALRLTRWANALIAAAGVLVGAWWAGWGDTSAIALASIAAIALTAAANTWNDLADIDIDRIAHPERPLPSGALSRAAAERIGMMAATGAVASASAVTVPLGLATVGVLLLMRLYSPWLKRAGFAGNLVVSVLASLPFLYGSYAAGRWQSGVPLVLLAIPLHLARELAKDLDDREADRSTRRTIPVMAGVHSARAALVAALLAGALAFGIGVAPQVKSLTLMFAALMPALAALALATGLALRGRPGSPAYFKLAMACAMAALLVARA
jgi:geranylgeranylglycerol-phosphate geranylgeranyltransferase